MRLCLSFICLASLPFAANSQTPTATYTWQVSENGFSWSNDLWLSVGTTAKVRLIASWSGIPDAVGVGYAGGQFDVRLLSASFIGAISNINRPVPFNFAPQTLVASTIAGGMKIDTSADVAGIGLGTGWVNPGQAAHFSNPFFNVNNDVVVFTFDVVVGSSMIDIDCILNGTTGRAMAVFSNSTGTQIRINASQTTVYGATINGPTPGSLALLGLGGIAIARRRREV